MLKSLIWGSGGPKPGDEETASNSAVKQESPEGELDDDATDDDTPRFRGQYEVDVGRAFAGPLSVNDPQFTCFSRGRMNPILSERYFTLCSPFGPPGVRNVWRMQSREAPEHVHRLLRAFVAAQDYAGAARALATLHRLTLYFDPDVYRYTSALLRLAGDHQQISMYFRKIVATKSRGHIIEASLQGRVVAHDFLSYLADRRDYKEALRVSKGILHFRGMSYNAIFKNDPMVKAHIAILFLFAGLLEHENIQRSADGDSPEASPSARIPGLQDPLALIGRLRVCRRECSVGSTAGIGVDARARAFAHLGHAKKLLRQAATGLPGNASIAGYRAALRAAEGRSVSALRQLADFVERNPGNVKGRSLHARLLQAITRDAGNRERVNAGVVTKDEEGGEEVRALEGQSNNRFTLAEVARTRALRGWLEADPLEPRAALGLAVLHSECSGAVLGVADKSFVVKHLLEQLETHGFPRTCPPARGTTVDAEAVLYTSRSALALWDSLANILGPLRVRDDPVPLFPRRKRVVPTQPPPRPGTIWDEVYGTDPPWNPTDFQRRERGDGGTRQRTGKNAGWEGAEGASLGPSAPHPLVRGVDQELWEETLLDPSAEPLFLGQAMATLTRGPRGDMWFGRMYCSDDEDCVLDSDPQALKEGARLAARRTGGCVYYSPPGVEGYVAGWGLGDRSQRRAEFGSTSSGPWPEDQGMDSDEGKSNECVREGFSVAPEVFDLGEVGEDEGREVGKLKHRYGVDVGDPAHSPLDGDSDKLLRVGTVSDRGDASPGSLKQEFLLRQGNNSGERFGDCGVVGEGYEGARAVDGGTRSGKRRQWRMGRQQEGDPKKRRSIVAAVDSEDDDEGDDLFEAARESDFYTKVDGGKGEGDDHYSTPSLHEEEAPLGPPVQADPAALELSETVSVRLPDEEAVSLLVNKACVAAHVFGPQHRYCLMAIWRLCRDDLRHVARPARDTLRRRGFRLQLSLGRLAAEIARDNAASVAWDFQEAPTVNALPPNAYIPRPLRDSVR